MAQEKELNSITFPGLEGTYTVPRICAKDNGSGNVSLKNYSPTSGEDTILNGGTMQGNINMNTNKLTNLPKPTEMKDAVSKESLLDLVYPVGAIFMSMNNISPQDFLGGTWERITDKFIFAAGTHSIGETGGEEEVTLNIGQMPEHGHQLQGKYGQVDGQVYSSIYLSGDVDPEKYALTKGSSRWSDGVFEIAKSGGNQPHNNMPPYLVAYMWKRTA